MPSTSFRMKHAIIQYFKANFCVQKVWHTNSDLPAKFSTSLYCYAPPPLTNLSADAIAIFSQTLLFSIDCALLSLFYRVPFRVK